MGRRLNLFNFLEKKMTNAEFAAVVAETMRETAFREMALHIAISYIANTLSKCEIKTYENGEEKKGLLYYRLNVSPNHNENSSQFINKFIEQYYYEGQALVVKQNEMLYCADSFSCDESRPLKEFVYENVTVGGQQIKGKLKASDVFYFKLDNEHTKRLVDLMNDKYTELMGLAIMSYKRTNGKKYKLIYDRAQSGDTKFNEEYDKMLKERLKAFIENDNAVYQQYKGMSLEEFSTASPTNSSDVIALRKEIFETTAQAFKIPLTMMYGNITNMDEIVKVYLSICIDPLADMLSEELTRKYFTFEEWQNGSYIEFDTSCIKYVDILEVADKADKAIASGLCCIDELRPRVKLKPLNSEFSTKHFITKNYEIAERVLTNEEGGENE